jgi:hypothetical protein
MAATTAIVPSCTDLAASQLLAAIASWYRKPWLPPSQPSR